MQTRHSDRLIAAVATGVIAAIILLVLFFSVITWDKAALAQASIPEITSAEDEVFLEPELLEEPGEELEEISDAPEAPAEQGEPEPAPEVNRMKEVKGENPDPAPKVDKVVSQTKPSPVKVTEPPKSDKEPKKATDPLAGKFSSRNGRKDGKAGGQGSGTDGISHANGSVRGRRFKGAPAFTAEVNQKYIVKVSVTVNEAGKVTEAHISDGGGAPTAVRNKCLQNAKKASWDAKPGAPDASGLLTYTITPKT